MTRKGSEISSGATWVVVADSSQADIYSRARRRSPLELVQSLSEPAARAKEKDLLADAPGRSFDSGGQGRHAMEPDHTEKQNLRINFADRIADFLESGRQAGNFKQLILVAAPALLGELRTQLNDPTAKLIRVAVDKDMTDATPARIAELIDAQ